MKKKLCSLFIILGIAILILSYLPKGVQAASNLNLKTLDYQVELKENGDAKVIETWQIQIKDTNTLYKTYRKDGSYQGISEVSVYEVTGGKKEKFTKINTLMYHVPKGEYYAMNNQSGNFEIAWGVNEKNKTKTYEIHYTIQGAVKTYQDCSEFYWQFQGRDFEVPADLVTGTIVLPKPVQEMDSLRVWAHGPLNGDIWREDNRTVKFQIAYLNANTYLEARVVTTENLFPQNTVSNSSKLNSILAQENKWAEESNQQREKYQKQLEQEEKEKRIMKIGFMVINVLVGIFLLYMIYRRYMQLKEIKKIKPEQELEYFRDFPRKDATPGEAAFLYYFRNTSLKANMAKVVSATMLNLALKRYLTFEVSGEKKNVIMVILTEEKKKEELKEDEKLLFEFLKKIKEEETKFTMKEFEKYTQKHATSFTKVLEKMEDAIKAEEKRNGNYNEDLMTKSNSYKSKFVIELFVGFFLLGLVPICSIGFWILAVMENILAKRYQTLTQQGENEKEKWKGLKKYMEDFSLLDEKEVPDLILWEKYLVYATSFGIADKVLKQLKVKYPQIVDETSFGVGDYAFMYLMYHHSLNTAFITSVNSSVGRAYNSAVSSSATSNGYNYGNFSSGGGFGGGFSGGGGFGGGGGGGGGR